MNQIPVMLFGTYYEPGSGGLSGEHIQLCAEGARRKPNLSGKRTEMIVSIFHAVLILWGLLFCLYFNERRKFVCARKLWTLLALYPLLIPKLLQ